MEFDNSFEVPLPPEQAWPLLMDIPAIAPCMPGAKLTEVVDDKTYKGNIAVRLGPVALTFAGTIIFEEIDNTGRALIDHVEEGRYDANGKWVMERRWNGDQTDWGLNFTGNPRVIKVKMGRYR